MLTLAFVARAYMMDRLRADVEEAAIRTTAVAQRFVEEAVLREQAGSLPLSEVLPRLRAQAGLRKVASVEFLATLQLSPRFVVEFPKPDVPVVRLAGGLALSAARARRV